MRDGALLIARLTLAGVFLFNGYEKITALDGVTARLTESGYPFPDVLAIVASVACLAGGISVALGAVTWLGCLALILFLLPATYTFHLVPGLDGDRAQIIQALKNLGLLGGLILLWMSGPGSLSVDREVFRRLG